MWDEHLNTILAIESDEFIKSCVKNLVPNPSESEGENGCDVPSCFTTFSNILFDAEYEFDSVDDQSCSDKDFSEEIFSNPLFEEEIIPIKIDQHHFNAESNLIESMLNHDSSIISSSLKIDSLLDEFAGELILLKSISPGIDKTDRDPEEDIRLIERLLYDNSSPRPPKEFVSENSNANIESFSPSPIPVEDSDSRMEEIDLSFNPDDLMPSNIEEDDDDSEREILIHEELLDNYCLSLPVNESLHFDIPSFSRPPAKPPDGNTGILNIKMMGDIFEQKICESNSHYGSECSQRVPLVYEPEPYYIQNFSDNEYSHDLPSVDPLIDYHFCYECGHSLNDFCCPDCTCEFCGNGAHVANNCPAQEFADELAHIISPSEYDCFYFRNLPDPGELIPILNSRICENLSSTTCVNLPIEDNHSPLLAYVVWIFLAYLTYPVIPPYLHLFGNEDTIFDLGITINRFYSFKPGLSHRCRAFKKFNTHRSHLNEWPMIINGKNTPILDVLLFHFYPP
uniref:Uncharacterized protein n=1 Tax=Tanacetum cinerariifolium TaxID=118510 RepID=A0A6L2J543_TANCI|nr:hypothetical protein [Tanacetum cinerariifolium]